MDFRPFPKIARFSRDIIITEKIDGTNAIIAIGEAGEFQVGSRNNWLTNEQGNIHSDNAGFANWAIRHRNELEQLGPGYHYGEWWGRGIQRGYGLNEKRFSLFNVARWSDDLIRPACCSVVPVLYTGAMSVAAVDAALTRLIAGGSIAAPGFAKPEGVVIFHTAGGDLFKKTIEKDEQPKGAQ